MSQIFKACHLTRGGVSHIFIFAGSHNISQSDDLGPEGKKVFTAEEAASIRRNGTGYTVIDAYLHGDDTIATIKRKLVYHCGSTGELKAGSTKELYLFALKRELLSIGTAYQRLTQDNTIDLTPARLCQYLLNIIPDGCRRGATDSECLDQIHGDMEALSFEDLTTLPDFNWQDHHTISVPIGQKLTLRRTYPFVANPFNCIELDPLLKKEVGNMITTQNKNLLFETGDLCNDTIYLCTATEVLQYAAEMPSMTEGEMLALYFPRLLVDDNIRALSDLQEKEHHLTAEQKASLGEDFERRAERVDLFYDIYDHRAKNLDYLGTTPGIRAIEFTIHPTYTINFPLEILFKLVHSTKQVPLVKYNPGPRRENIYRLYTDGTQSTDGRGVPYLYTQYGNKKGKIIRLSRAIAKGRRVAFYIEVVLDNHTYELVCEFEANGNITVALTLPDPQTLETIETVVSDAINGPILDKIRGFLEQSGYSYVSFNGLRDNNIEIRKLTFISSLVVRKNIHLGHYTGCLSSVFNVLEGDLSDRSDTLRLQYKRVSNYNLLGAEEAFINEMRRQGADPKTVVRDLKTNFQLSEEEAKVLFANWARDVRTETDVFENKRLTVRTNTGFPIFIVRDKTNFHTTITVESIDNLGYLPFIHLYLDAMMRLVIDKKGIGIPSSRLKQLCSGEVFAEKEEEEDADITAIADQQVRKVPTGAEEGQFDSLLDLLGGDDEFDDDIEFGEGIEFGDEMEFGEEIEVPPTPTEPASAKDPGGGKKEESPAHESEEKIPSPGSEVTSEAEVDLTTQKLSGGDNIFITKKLARDPELFAKTGDKKYKAYSKACPSQYRKQPIILTDEEKAYIDEMDGEQGVRSYDESITYGSGDVKYHYICPRFWCLYDREGKERSITLEEINSGGCGGWSALIPPNAKKPPPGGRIYQFTDKHFHKEDAATNNPLVYKQFYPGFQQGGHPKGLCVPCCFGRPNTASPDMKWIKLPGNRGYKNLDTGEVRKGAHKPPRLAYDGKDGNQLMYKPKGAGITGVPSMAGPGPTFTLNDDGSIDLASIKGEVQQRELPAARSSTAYAKCDQSSKRPEESKGPKIISKTLKADEAPLWDAFPLRAGQLGYLSETLQRFLQWDQRTNDRRLKLDRKYLLRMGMEPSDTQSFVACIADLYSHIGEPPTARTKLTSHSSRSIATMKQIIIDLLTIDNFISYQNGTLVKTFGANPAAATRPASIARYKGSHLYKSLPKDRASQEYFRTVVVAFHNFTDFLTDEKTRIDHTYLWDIVCMPRDAKNETGGLFEGGLNLLLFKSPANDVTDKIEVICPTNHYSSQIFQEGRPILMLYTRDGYYEPIYLVTKVSSNQYEIDRLFKMSTLGSLAPQIAPVIRSIRKIIRQRCKPLPSMPRLYNEDHHFRSNIPLDDIIAKLANGSLGVTPDAQIVNLDTKAVGIALGTQSGKVFYLPSRPSAIKQDLPIVMANDPALIQAYGETVELLKTIQQARPSIPCSPVMKVVDNGVTVGIITQTNQFIPTFPEPYQAVPGGEPDGLGVLTEDTAAGHINYKDIDHDTMEDKSIDRERINVVKRIKLESNFFNVFRNTLRLILNDFDNADEKARINAQLTDPVTPYLQKLTRTEALLRKIMTPFVQFVDFKLDALEDVEAVSRCLGLDGADCQSSGSCTFGSDSGICMLNLPARNLISGGNNRVQYYGRLADELIRHDRIRTFIFQPRTFLSFQKMPYNLRDNEIILLEEILYGGYFNNLVPRTMNPFIKTTALFDTVEPSQSVPYSSSFSIVGTDQQTHIDVCTVQSESQRRLTIGKRWRDDGLNRPIELLEFKPTIPCNWRIMVEILSDALKTPIDSRQIRTDLIEIYSNVVGSQIDRRSLIALLRAQGKKLIAGYIDKGTAIDTVITLADYYLTQLDFLLLAIRYRLPLLLMSRTDIPTLGSRAISFAQAESDAVYVIFGGAWSTLKVNVDKPPILGLLTVEDSIHIPKPALQPISSYFEGNCVPTIAAYLERFKTVTTRKIRRPKGFRVRLQPSKTPSKPETKVASKTKKPTVRKLKGKLKLKIKRPSQ